MQATPQHLVDRGFYRWPIGPEAWRVCDTCNHGGHTCHFCGDDIGHGETMPGPNMHACYIEIFAGRRLMYLEANIAYWRKQVALMDAEVAAGLLPPDDGALATCRNTLRELMDIDGAPDAGGRVASDGS